MKKRAIVLLLSFFLLPLSLLAQPCATDEVSISLDPNAIDVENPASEDYFYNLTFECS